MHPWWDDLGPKLHKHLVKTKREPLLYYWATRIFVITDALEKVQIERIKSGYARIPSGKITSENFHYDVYYYFISLELIRRYLEQFKKIYKSELSKDKQTVKTLKKFTKTYKVFFNDAKDARTCIEHPEELPQTDSPLYIHFGSVHIDEESNEWVWCCRTKKQSQTMRYEFGPKSWNTLQKFKKELLEIISNDFLSVTSKTLLY